MEKLSKDKIIWWLFFATLALVMLDAYVNLVDPKNLELVNILTLIAPVLLFAFHAIGYLGWKQTVVFVIGAGVFGWGYEVAGIETGVLFGGAYHYNSEKLGPLVAGVPVLIPVFWIVFSYTAYCVTNALWLWKGQVLPNYKNDELKTVMKLMFQDCLIVISIDLLMDPLFVHEGFWTWEVPGAYYGIPIGNFIGWGVVALIISMGLRTYQYYHPQSVSTAMNKTFLIPVLGYGALGLVLIFGCVHAGLIEEVKIGSLLLILIFSNTLIHFFKKS